MEYKDELTFSEACKLLDEVIKEGFDTTLYNIGSSWCCRIGDECFYAEGNSDTKEEAICNAFIIFKERDN